MTKDLLNIEEDGLELLELGFSDGKALRRNLLLLSSGPLKGSVEKIAKLAASSPSPDNALNNLETVVSATTEETIKRLAGDPEALAGLITLCGSSPMLSGILSANPGYLEWLFFEGGLGETKDRALFDRELKERTRDLEELPAAQKALRVFRNREFLRLGARDLLGVDSVEGITKELSGIAGATLHAAVDFALMSLIKAFGRPMEAGEDEKKKEAGFSVIGLGKLGGGELNFSSDIDILYIYSSDNGETTGVEDRTETRISLHDFFVRLSTMITKLIGSVTEDGFVFRVDLDLRPEGRSGALANSLRGAENYYESWGQAWERAAMIKARPVAGDPEVGEAFLKMIQAVRLQEVSGLYGHR